MTLQDIKNYIIARIFPNTSQAITGATMQDTLLQMADSMNTPSGDPMHYAYVAAGAVWNASTGLWSYREEEGGLTDLTNEDMQVCYAERWGTTNTAPGAFARIQGRTGLNNMLWSATSDFYNSVNACPNLEVFFIKGLNLQEACPRNLNSSFYNCPKLHTIGSPLYRKDVNLQYMTTVPTNCFALLPALRNIYLRNVRVNLSFADSPLLSKESLLYMIDNCASGVSFTITLHPYVYAKCTRVDEGEGQYVGEWWEEIDDALGYAEEIKGTTITLASA